MFITPIEDFYFKPYLLDGKIQRGLVVLQKPLAWLVYGKDRKFEAIYIVPAGFVLNLGSFPWWSSWALKKLGRNVRGSTLHDWLYGNKINSKAWSDAEYRRAMAFDKVVGWRRGMAWSGVALGGWWAWWKKTDVRIVPV